MAPLAHLLSIAFAASHTQVGAESCPEQSEEATLLQMKPAHARSHAGPEQSDSRQTNDNGADAYIGCFVDDGGRDLEYQAPFIRRVTNSYAGCLAACSGYSFMSLQAGGQCFCGNSYGNKEQYVQVDDSECIGQDSYTARECTYVSHSCGAGWRNAIYRVEDKGANNYIGCFTDDGGRDLEYRVPWVNTVTNSYHGCFAACNFRGYSFMSLQNGGNDCFCGNSYGNEGHEQVDDSECIGTNSAHRDCRRLSHSCGASWRNAIYEIPETQNAGANAYIGCFTDDGGRDLEYRVPWVNTVTNNYHGCFAACNFRGYSFMSLQNGGNDCFCGNSYGNEGHEQVDDSECIGTNSAHRDCRRLSHSCGASWRNAIYNVGR